MSEREYDASVDLHDSYYAAVGALRQEWLDHGGATGLPALPPGTMKAEQAKADAIIAYAAKMQDWPLLEQAIDLKIEEQQDFVRWWDKTVSPLESPGSNQHRSVIASVTDLPARHALERTGIRKQTVSLWRKKLADEIKYRTQQIIAAFRKAGLVALANHLAQGTGENEWFTPPEYIEAAREVMGEINLDPATHPVAQQTVQAQRYFTAADDGLSQQWWGRVWLNPPYVQPLIARFVAKMVEELTQLGENKTVTQAIMLTHNYTDTAWFHQAEAAADLICFTRGRIKFVDIDGDECAPTQGQAFFYYGPNVDRFREVFSQFGFVR